MADQVNNHAGAEADKVFVLMAPLYFPLPGILQLLEERYTVLQTEELDAKAASRVSAVFTGRRVDRSFLDSLPNLRLVVNLGVGVDNIDVDYCRQRDIRITNAVHARIIADTADSAILLMLASLRRLCPANSFVQDGSWARGLTFPLARKASGLQVGIVGLGRIGRAIAKRAAGFNSIISYFGPTKKQDVPYAYYTDLIALAANSDVLIVSCLLSKDTTHLIGKDVLDALGPTGSLINIARGPVVDELELCKALVEKRLGAAGLDVFEKEPFVPAELLGMENVVLNPHIAAATYESRVALGQLVVDNLNAFFSGKPLLTPVV